MSFTIYTDWGEIDVKLNEDAKPPWGKVYESNFIFWKFYLDIIPNDKINRPNYIKGIECLINDLYRNGCQVIAACDFEKELSKYT